MGISKEIDKLLHVGTARAPITPPVGFPISHPEHGSIDSKYVDDDLMAKAIFFSSGSSEAVVLSLDVWGIAPDLRSNLVNSISSFSGVPKNNIWITCTGNGTSPATSIMGSEPDIYVNYNSYLPEICGGVSIQAKNDSSAAAMGTSQVMLPGVSTGVCKNTEGDPIVQMAVFETSDGKNVGLVTSFSCPSVIRGPDGIWTADYPGYAAWFLEQMGTGNVLFARGTDSDIRPFDWYFGNQAPSHPDRSSNDVSAFGLLFATQVSSKMKNIVLRRNVEIYGTEVKKEGVKVLRIGPLVFISIASPQPNILGNNIRSAIPESTIIVSANLDGYFLEIGQAIDESVELVAIDTARSLGAE